MDSDAFPASAEGGTLPLASLRLLVPPLQLLSASMWQVVRRRDVMKYWRVAEHVSLVLDVVPELLVYEHRTQLSLGLRARYILELCRSEELIQPDFILSHLEKIKAPCPAPMETSRRAEEGPFRFPQLIHALLKDPEERRDFFTVSRSTFEYFLVYYPACFLKDVFPAEYGPQYDSDLQTLFSEFLSRLARLLPVPELEQTISWLGAECPALDGCMRSVSEPTDLRALLQHHKQLGHLEQHVPPSTMGDRILSSLSAVCPSKASPSRALVLSGPLRGDGDGAEVITVTDCAEVELDASAGIEAVTGERGCEVTAVEEALHSGEEPAPHGTSPGRHDCPECKKKCKFASSLTAHKVVHTGERPHRCSDCGRCFSFRQSLDRHRRTHGTRRRHACSACSACSVCSVCSEGFRAPAARTRHKQTHAGGGGYACPQCGKTFSREHALARHLKGHTGGHSADERAESPERGQQVPGFSDAPEPNSWVEVDLDNESSEPPRAVSPVKVRTSGRRPKPTMKIQVIHLQKNMAAKRRQEVSRAKAEPLSWAEHAYGSSRDASKPSDKTLDPSADFSCPERVQRRTERLRPGELRGGRFSCSDCEKSFKFQSLLKAHRRIHTGEQPFLCAQCGRRFSFKQSLERHAQTHKSGRRYECLICGEFFKSPAAQRQHESSHMEDGDYLCSECGRSFTWKSALVRHLKTLCRHDTEPSLKCPRCDLRFSGASDLDEHLQTHGEERAHACSCGKSFAYRAALAAHQRTHQKERPHACAQCGKGFLYRGGLLSHMKVHSEDTPFTCSFCGKSFKRERSMKKHERFHTRENVFGCSQCDKSFVYKATLVRHELTHSGERPYLCSDCGKGFFSHAELLKHERFHTGHKPFQCPHCDKKFTQSCYLTLHLRYHSGVRPYACAECDKSFLSANRLKRHQRTHSGEKPYACGACGKGFRQSYNLKMHQRTHASKIT
ncbi:zinc finger protein 709-like [Brachionichthys hirsutus]|uniref:zinc finger protein 709-like n=1 Tax=Brachionichthys hirsutus TaxID=412623 RepID=UPI003605072C